MRGPVTEETAVSKLGDGARRHELGGGTGNKVHGGEAGAHAHGGRRLGLDAEVRIGHAVGPTIGAGLSMWRLNNKGESMQLLMFPRPQRRARSSTSGAEAGGGYRPSHLRTGPPTFSDRTAEFLSFERKFLWCAQRHNIGIALLEETEIQLSDATVTPEHLLRNDFSQQ